MGFGKQELANKNVLFILCTNMLQISLVCNNKVMQSISYDGSNLADVIVDKINNLLLQNSFDITKLDLLVVVNGPGSFTAIRAGVVVVNTISLALNIPIVRFNYFELLNHTFVAKHNIEEGLIINTLNIGSSAIILGLFNGNEQLLEPFSWDFNHNMDDLNNIFSPYFKSYKLSKMYAIGSAIEQIKPYLIKLFSNLELITHSDIVVDINNIMNLNQKKEYTYNVEPLYVSQPNIIMKKYGA